MMQSKIPDHVHESIARLYSSMPQLARGGVDEMQFIEALSKYSHALRSPLTSIIGFAEMLLDDPNLGSSQRLEFARYIRDEGWRLNEMVDMILLLADNGGQADGEA